MNGLALLIGLVVGLIALIVLAPFILIHLRREREGGGNANSRAGAIPDEQLREHLLEVLEIFPHLPEATQQRVETLTRDFLARVRITGKGKHQPTAVMVATIAANAAILCLHPHAQAYPGLKQVLVLTPDAKVKLKPAAMARKKGLLYLDWDDTVSAAGHDDANQVIRAFARLQADEEERSNFLPQWTHDVGHAPAMIGAEQKKLEHAAPAWLFEEKMQDREALYLAATDAFFHHPGIMAQENRGLYDLFREFFALEGAKLMPAPTRQTDERSGLSAPVRKALLGVMGRFTRQ